jgi:hypothetical protein
MGDFVFQTNGIAKAKMSGLKGLFVHSGIVCITQLVFLSVYGIKGIVAAVINGMIHFVLDWSKNKTSRYFGRAQTFQFVADQLIHIVVMYVLTVIMAGDGEFVDQYVVYIKGGIAFITLTYVSTVGTKQLLRDIYKHINCQAFFLKYERLADACTAIALWMVCFLPMYWGVAAGIIQFYGYYWYQHQVYRYGMRESLIKYFIYAFTAFLLHHLL